MTVNMFHYWLTRGWTGCIRRYLRTMPWDRRVGNSASAVAKEPLDMLSYLLVKKFCGVAPSFGECASLLGRAYRETWLPSNDRAD
jgi:hypothetical protein